MQRNSVLLARLLGVPLRIHNSWFLVLPVLAWSLASQYLPIRYPDWSLSAYWIAAVLISGGFFLSALLHEMAHIAMRHSRGLPVHEDILFLFGGAPELMEEPERKEIERNMAIAGPLTNLALVIPLFALWLITRNRVPEVAGIAVYLGGLNALLCLLNLLPGFPLDGGRLVRGAIWFRTQDLQRATRWATNLGQWIMYLFVALGALLVSQRVWVDGVWLMLIGWLLGVAAQTSLRQIAIQQFLQAHLVREAMTGACDPIGPNTTLDILVRDYMMPKGMRCYPVISEGETQGVISPDLVRKVPQANWSQVTVRAVTYPLDRVRSLRPEDTLWQAMERLSNNNREELPITQDGQFLGILTYDDVVHFIRSNSRVAI